MRFLKLTSDFLGYKAGDCFCQSSIHHTLVKVATPTTKTEYTNISKWECDAKEFYKKTTTLTLNELKRLLPHLTWILFSYDATFVLQGKGGNWFDVLKKPKGIKLAPLPPIICFDCMLKGNKYMPHTPTSHLKGVCKCCNEEKRLVYTRIGWPLDLTKQGFDFNILATGGNYHLNKNGMYKAQDMSRYKNYDGTLKSLL